MTHDKTPQTIAPCVIETGIIIHKEDIKRLIGDLGQVRYIHTLDGQIQNEGEGWLIEVFIHPCRCTMVANHKLYINLQSFDYLQLSQSADKQTCFDLIQDNRQLRLMSLSQSDSEQNPGNNLNMAVLEAMVSQVLSSKWDIHEDDREDGDMDYMDDDDDFDDENCPL